MKKRLRKILKIAALSAFVMLIGFYVFFVRFSSPKSNAVILKKLSNNYVKPIITTHQFSGFSYRVIAMQQKIDTTLPTIVFVHGAPGSAMDFQKYLVDSTLNVNANLIAYDRIGYNYNSNLPPQKSLQFEASLLQDLTKDFNKKKTILVGYSYGGPIVLAVKEYYKRFVLLAPAVYSKAESYSWFLNFYKWKLTRWLVPRVWQSASQEKLHHKQELEKFEKNWTKDVSKITVIQGTADWIVPYQNSQYLKQLFPSNQLHLITIPKAGHALVWTHFKLIKQTLLNSLH